MEKDDGSRVEPKQTFNQLTYAFTRETWAVSTPKGFRSSPAYQKLVEMGEVAIPQILDRIWHPGYIEGDLKRIESEDSRWIALALDDITGQDVTGYAQLQGNIGAMVERALQWGEKESLIMIRSDEETYKIGQELFNLTKDYILLVPEGKDALANAFFELETDDDSERIANFIVNGSRVSIRYDPNPFGNHRTLELVASNPSSTLQLQIDFWEYSEQERSAGFQAPGARRTTRMAEANFRKTLAEIFEPQPEGPMLRAAYSAMRPVRGS